MNKLSVKIFLTMAAVGLILAGAVNTASAAELVVAESEAGMTAELAGVTAESAGSMATALGEVMTEELKVVPSVELSGNAEAVSSVVPAVVPSGNAEAVSSVVPAVDESGNAETVSSVVPAVDESGNAEAVSSVVPAVTAPADTPVEATVMLMYATASVNVRSGPSTAHQVLGTLAKNQAIHMTGRAENGWYQVDYNGTAAFVSNRYLQESVLTDTAVPEPASLPDTPAVPQQFAAAQPGTNVTLPGAPVVFIGDSRFVQMQEAVGINPYAWVAESGKGYDWFVEKGAAWAEGSIGTGTKVVINLGVNDVRNADQYIELFNAKAAEWTMRGATVYYASVNPVWENPYVTREQVEAFNLKMQASLAPYIHWIDSYTYLQMTGCKIVDGLHYDDATYLNIYTYYLNSI